MELHGFGEPDAEDRGGGRKKDASYCEAGYANVFVAGRMGNYREECNGTEDVA